MGKQNENHVNTTVTTTHSQIPPECAAVKQHCTKKKNNTNETVENVVGDRTDFKYDPLRLNPKISTSLGRHRAQRFVCERGGENRHGIRCVLSPQLRLPSWFFPMCRSQLVVSPHVELDESSSKDSQRADEANGHEDAE